MARGTGETHLAARVLPILVALAACAPDISQQPPPGPAVFVEFDPGAAVPVVPAPNDLALDPASHRIVVPPLPGDSPAQGEFNQGYLGALGGFPYESTAVVLVHGALDASSVGPRSVLAIDLTAAASGAPSSVPISPTYDPASGAIRIPPPGGAWTRAHRYAVALLAGPGGLRGAAGAPVIGSETWELVSSPNPLVACPGGVLTSPGCTLAVDVIPSTVTDPAARTADQLKKALALEAIRAGYAPLLSQLEKANGLARTQIPILWTFTIVDAGEVTFDPAGGVVPFPNDVLMSNGKVALPNPSTGNALTAADCTGTDPTLLLYCGLDTLDGFSTLAPPVSEGSLTAGAVAQGDIDPTTLSTTSVGLLPVKSSAPASERTAPQYVPCLNCLSSLQSNGQPQTAPQQLQWRLLAPLDETTTYLSWVTADVKDTRGTPVIASPAFALVRSSNPLVVGGHSAVSILTDLQAAQLEPLRAAMKPVFDLLDSQGLPRARLALAWTFTTQSEASQLDALRAYPAQVPNLPGAPLYVYDATAPYMALATLAGITNVGTNVGRVLAGAFMTPLAVTGPGGTLNVAAPQPEPVAFVMTIPKAAPPAGGYPVTIFGHAFTRSRQDFLAIAGGLADPALGPLAQITIATDTLLHGERSSCTGSAAATGQASDDAACADPSTQKCDEDPLLGRCVARDVAARQACTPGAAGAQACAGAGQGACLATGTCEGGDLLRDGHGSIPPAYLPFQRPVISGWNILDLTNFFATRDNFRQQVIDLSQLVRVLGGTGAGSLAAQAGAPLDLTRLGYVGQNLGGILGTLYNAVSPETKNVVLDVPGGALPRLILDSPAFAGPRQTLLSVLAGQGIEVGTPAFDQFVGIAQWVLDPADPANLGWRLTHPVDLGGGLTAPGADRKALLQFIEGDQTVPYGSSLALVAAANRTLSPAPPSFGCGSPLFCYEFTEAGDAFDATSAPLASRDGFLLQPPSATAAGVALTTRAQAQVAQFLALGRLP